MPGRASQLSASVSEWVVLVGRPPPLPVKRALCLAALVIPVWVTSALSAEPECAHPSEPTVVLRSSAAGRGPFLEEMGRQLGAGLATSGIRVCVGESPSEGRVAQVDVDVPPEGEVSVRITLRDDVTTKTLQRSVDLSAIPTDSRAVAVALYVEELLQASWAELALQKRVYLREHAPAAPPEVRREVEGVLPVSRPPAAERRLRLSLGGAVASSRGGLLQAGPELSAAFRALPWLEAEGRVGYRIGPSTAAPHGTITGESILAGAFVDFVWPLAPAMTLHFPQGADAFRVTFFAHANPGALANSDTRFAVVVSHGVGLRLALGPVLSISAIGRFCWTALPADAADDHHVVTGVSGVGGEGKVEVDALF
jgi:hypothetical protein